MTATAGEVVLERLQKQVLSEGCPIRSACVRVDNLIEGAAKDESCRVLLGILPALLNVMFGDPHQVDTLEGWVGKTRDRETANTLFTLLEPKGRLFSLLLQHSDFEDGRRPVYQLPIGPNDCPLPRPFLNKLLSYGSADTFPTPFNKLITRTNLVDPPFTLGLGKLHPFPHQHSHLKTPRNYSFIV